MTAAGTASGTENGGSAEGRVLFGDYPWALGFVERLPSRRLTELLGEQVMALQLEKARVFCRCPSPRILATARVALSYRIRVGTRPKYSKART